MIRPGPLHWLTALAVAAVVLAGLLVVVVDRPDTASTVPVSGTGAIRIALAPSAGPPQRGGLKAAASESEDATKVASQSPPDSVPRSHPEPKPKSQQQPEPEPESAPDRHSLPSPEPTSEPDPESAPESEPEALTKSHSQPKPAPSPVPELKPTSEPDSSSQSPVSVPQTVAERESAPASGSDGNGQRPKQSGAVTHVGSSESGNTGKAAKVAATSQTGSGRRGGSGTLRDAPPSYRQQLRSWLARHRDYPRRAQRLSIEGVATVAFTIDRSGNVLHWEITNSSGKPILDRAVAKMIQRADPFPPMPDSMTISRMNVLQPVSFQLN